VSRERAMLAGTRVLFQNAAIKWQQMKVSSNQFAPGPNEVVAYVLDPGAWVGVPKDLDHRDNAGRGSGPRGEPGNALSGSGQQAATRRGVPAPLTLLHHPVQRS
jgi:hypothetical protein